MLIDMLTRARQAVKVGRPRARELRVGSVKQRPLTQGWWQEALH